MEKIRVKFKCISITETMGTTKDDNGNWIPAKMKTIEMSPVYGNNDPNHENTKFWKATPSGTLKLGVIPETVSSYFELDKEYYLDITEANK